MIQEPETRGSAPMKEKNADPIVIYGATDDEVMGHFFSSRGRWQDVIDGETIILIGGMVGMKGHPEIILGRHQKGFSFVTATASFVDMGLARKYTPLISKYMKNLEHINYRFIKIPNCQPERFMEYAGSMTKLLYTMKVVGEKLQGTLIKEGGSTQVTKGGTIVAHIILKLIITFFLIWELQPIGERKFKEMRPALDELLNIVKACDGLPVHKAMAKAWSYIDWDIISELSLRVEAKQEMERVLLS